MELDTRDLMEIQSIVGNIEAAAEAAIAQFDMQLVYCRRLRERLGLNEHARSVYVEVRNPHDEKRKKGK